MLCCAGLIAGVFVGYVLGGIWIFLGPALGFGLGFVGDMIMFRKKKSCH